MQESGLLYTLWFMAIKEPFDMDGFRTVLNVVRKIRPNYFAIPIDVIIVMNYIAFRYGNEIAEKINKNYKEEFWACVKTGNEQLAEEIASAMSWIGDTETEETIRGMIR